MPGVNLTKQILCHWLSRKHLQPSLMFQGKAIHLHMVENCLLMEQGAFKNVNNCLNTNIYSYLEILGGQSSNLYLSVVHFFTPGLIRHLWQNKTVFSCIGL